MFKTLIGVFLAVSLASGADFSGIWTGVMTDRNGDLQDLSFRFSQNEYNLTGKMYGDNESIAITDGKIDGDKITFLITTELNGSITRMMFTGTLVNGEIQVIRSRVDAAKKAENDKPNAKQTFVLKRL